MSTAIEWTNETWNPLTGCTRVTKGCDHCYAFTLHDMRLEAFTLDHGTYPNGNSMSDLFHSQVPDDYIFQVFDVMRRAHWHTFQVLTKRAGRLRRLGPLIDWPANVWMGVSLENDVLTPRADALRECPAAVRFLSCEPLLGPLPSLNLTGLHWIITGGESGKGARPCHPEWVREIRDRCQDAGVALFHKQWGGRTPKANGRVLDGQTWDQFPAVRGCGAGACLNLASPRLLAKGYRACEGCAAAMAELNNDNREAFYDETNRYR